MPPPFRMCKMPQIARKALSHFPAICDNFAV